MCSGEGCSWNGWARLLCSASASLRWEGDQAHRITVLKSGVAEGNAAHQTAQGALRAAQSTYPSILERECVTRKCIHSPVFPCILRNENILL